MSYNEQLRCDYLTTNHEGAVAWRMTPEWELYSTVVTTMGVEDKFYERGNDRVRRIAELVRKVQPEYVAQLAIYAREAMHLRSVPLLLLVELARWHRGDSLVSRAVSRTVQRADEITELLMCYQWRMRKKGLTGLSSQLRKGLAEAFNHFDEYQFAKYNRTDRKVTLRDALLLVHPKPKDERQKEIFKKILNGSLETPYTWETELSRIGQQHFASKNDKKAAVKEVWQELIASRRMGYMATLRNLRNMLDALVDSASMEQVCNYLANPEAVKNSKQLPFRFLSAYLQLKEIISSFNLPLKDVIYVTTCRINLIEKAIEVRKTGIIHARVRKVVRYPSFNTIGQCANVRGDIKYAMPTRHASRMVFCKMRTKQPSERMQKVLRQLENVLLGLRKRESLLRRKQAMLLEKYGSPCLKKAQLCEGVFQALENAACQSAVNIPGFDENTRVLLASDVSGSMCCPVSANSSVMYYHIGILLSMLMKHCCPHVVTGLFGDIWKVYDMPSTNVLQNTMDMIDCEGEVGYSTNGHKVIDWLIEKQRVMDKVMLFTDCELWDSYCLGDSLGESWDKYKLLAPDAKLYLFDLAGYEQIPISMERDDVFSISGWSDKVFDILAALERGNSAIDEIRRIVV
ncbi:MAG: TROVE domain-containing protein [Prevotella sp.]|nr:TROVE domain-containing protein [Prevotella sp.]